MEIKDRRLRLHTTAFVDVVFVICTKVTILLYLFDVV